MALPRGFQGSSILPMRNFQGSSILQWGTSKGVPSFNEELPREFHPSMRNFQGSSILLMRNFQGSSPRSFLLEGWKFLMHLLGSFHLHKGNPYSEWNLEFPQVSTLINTNNIKYLLVTVRIRCYSLTLVMHYANVSLHKYDNQQMFTSFTRSTS